MTCLFANPFSVAVTRRQLFQQRDSTTSFDFDPNNAGSTANTHPRGIPGGKPICGAVPITANDLGGFSKPP
jgi:hypothetical protein